MNISKREKKIIELLLEQKNGVTLDFLTETLHVSNRTIYREVLSLESTLAKYQIKLVREPDKGYRLIGNSVAFQELQESLYHSSKELTVQQRQSLLVIQLLLSEEEVKMEALAIDLQVSIGTIQSDLLSIEDIFKDYEIKIERKKAKGISAVAKESNRRLIVSGLISSEINEYDFTKLLNNLSKKSEDNSWMKKDNQFLNILDKQVLSNVNQVLKEFNQDFFKRVTDTQFQKLIILLTFSIMRIKQGKELEVVNAMLETVENSISLNSSKDIFTLIKKLDPFEMKLEEIYFLAIQLEGLNVHIRKEFFSKDYDANLSFKVNELITRVSKQMDWDFNQDETLYKDLLTHISAAVKRSVAPMPSNLSLLLQKVHSQYNQLSLVVEKNLKHVFLGIDFLPEEIIYVVIHFASTYEKLIARKDISVLVVCSSGIGMAKILQNRLKKNISEISSITTARISQLEDLKLENYDLVLSTIFLKGFETEYKVVTPLLMDDEIKSIRQSIKQLKKQPTPIEDLASISLEDHEFKNFYKKIMTVNQLLERFNLREWKEHETIDALLSSICFDLEKSGILSNPEKVKKKLLERMNTAPIGLPETNMALFHCIDQEVMVPYFAIYDVPNSFIMDSIDKETIEMKRVLMMIGPNPLSEIDQEVLGLISSTIVESNLNLEIFNTGSKKMITNYLNILFLEKYKK
ncbi:MAG: transcription antiterminator [Carnobacterium sp.]|nr:transcription antiterminator [Carnobacterium sp.]